MDVELNEVEIVFAQKLASGEPITRRRAFRTLLMQVAGLEFESGAMLHLSKGLHYAMWMQDKMLWQEQLADNIASLLTRFVRESESALFVKCMLICLSHEWPRIDRWRMDKFLMLMRRLVRTLFSYLRSKDWEPSLTNMYITALKGCVISSGLGLKFHFASIYLDELDAAGGLSADQVTEMLKPFAELLADGTLSNYLFNSFLQEIFVTILHHYAEARAMKSAKDHRVLEESASSVPIKFNYAAISQLLLETGKSPSVRSARRKQLYAVAKKFKAVEGGEEPFVMATKKQTRLKAKLPRAEVVNAVTRLLNEQAKDKSPKKRAKLSVKRKTVVRKTPKKVAAVSDRKKERAGIKPLKLRRTCKKCKSKEKQEGK
ncbi:unnamed protein product [Gongylonema pulchrum]|uniref:NopRA1 domain-containing protein n=1 Tax=Gongylonema pulchrum TaxID=637853 RepID=A0A183DYN5_9BILA|nr:unnamed protein product [Gongylonema pulchrum]